MDYFLAILPAIIIIFLILVLAYLTQTSLRNKYITPLETKVDDLEKTLKQRDKDIRDLTSALIGLQSEVEKMADDTMTFLRNQPVETAKKSEPVETMTDFYMSTPNKDGSFNMASYTETFRPSVSIYRFSPLTKTQAEFQFESDEQGMRDALNFSKSYIEPVCEEENDVTPESKRIITLKKGLADLHNGQWTVVRKALIRYE